MGEYAHILVLKHFPAGVEENHHRHHHSKETANVSRKKMKFPLQELTNLFTKEKNRNGRR